MLGRSASPSLRRKILVTALLILAPVVSTTPADAWVWEYEDCLQGCMKCAGFLTVRWCQIVNQENGRCDCDTDCFGEFGNMVCSCNLGGDYCFGVIVEPVP